MKTINEFLKDIKFTNDDRVKQNRRLAHAQGTGLLPITEMAKLSGVSASTIRSYDKKGWLEKADVEIITIGGNGIRLFRSEDADTIKKIRDFNKRQRKVRIKAYAEKFRQEVKEDRFKRAKMPSDLWDESMVAVAN